MACGKPRELLPGTVVITGSLIPEAVVPTREALSAFRKRGRAWPWYGAAAAATALGAVATLLTLAVFGSVAGGIVAAGTLIASAALALQGRGRAKEQEQARSELAILKLAESAGGSLTATQVARALSIATVRAERLLAALVGDGSRVHVEVAPEGVLHYQFRELEAQLPAAPAVNVRVASEPAPQPLESRSAAVSESASEVSTPEAKRNREGTS